MWGSGGEVVGKCVCKHQGLQECDAEKQQQGDTDRLCYLCCFQQKSLVVVRYWAVDKSTHNIYSQHTTLRSM
jgi:hypothetical protein